MTPRALHWAALVGLTACRIGGEGPSDLPANVTDIGNWPLQCVQSGPPADGLCASAARPDEFAASGYWTTDFGRSFQNPSKMTARHGFTFLSDGTPCVPDAMDAGVGRRYRVTGDVFKPDRLERSDDEGATWRSSPLPEKMTGPEGGRGVVALGSRAFFYLERRLWRSLDSGTTWVAVAAPAVAKVIGRVVLGPGGRVALDLFEDGMWASDDDGAKWRRVEGPQAGRIEASPDGELWAHVARSATVDVDLRPGHLWRSTDWGRTWQVGKLVFGPFDWSQHYGPGAADGFLPVIGARALGAGQFVFGAKAVPGKAARTSMACFVGRKGGLAAPALPVVPPASDAAAGTMAPFLWDVEVPSVAPVRLVVAKNRTPWPLHVRAPKFGPPGQPPYDTHQSDPYGGCKPNPLGVDGFVMDVDLDRATGDVMLLHEEAKIFPDHAGATNATCIDNKKPHGVNLVRLDPVTAAPSDKKIAGPIGCSQPARTGNLLIGCGNGKCDVNDKFACPAECGIQTCGNAACDDWEQLWCPTDCKGKYFGGTCGNLVCDDGLFERIFCASDCPPLPPICKKADYSAVMAKPLRLFAPDWVVLETGLYKLPVAGSKAPPVGPLLAPFEVGALDRAANVFWVLGPKWLARRVPGQGNPCADPKTTESADCVPRPQGGTVTDVEVGADGFLYATVREAGQVVRRPLAAAQAAWEVVIERLWAPQDLWVDAQPGQPTRLHVMDGDVWVGVVGAKLPLVKTL